MAHQINLEQLLRVATERKHANSALDMSCWWHPCGTFGCLAGWAAHDPFFEELGLRVLPGTYAGNGSGTIHNQGVLILWLRANGKPAPLNYFEALQYLFELDEHQALYLFGNNPDATMHDAIVDWDDAIERIKDVMEGRI